MSRKQVEESPPYESDRPISDEYRMRLSSHYGWPQTVGAGGFSAPAILASETIGGRTQSGPDPEEVEKTDAENLRSVREILGYTVISQDEADAGEVSDAVLNRSLTALPYLRAKETDMLRSRNWIFPWECIASFDLTSQSIHTSVDNAILSNAPEAPEEGEFADGSVERAIRNYFQL